MPPASGIPPMGAGAPPSPAPPPSAALAMMRPPQKPGGGMGQSIMLFLAGLGFHNFAKAVKDLRPEKSGDKKPPSQAQGLLSMLGASRGAPGLPVGGAGGTPALLGDANPGFLALLAKLYSATGRGEGAL